MSNTTAVLVAFALVLAAGTTARAYPRQPRLSWSSPDTAHTQTITWTSDSADEPSFVEYGLAAPGEAEIEGTAFQGNDGLGAIHVVELEGLIPGTTYKYRAGGPGNWTDTYEFTTGIAGVCGKWSFAALGDNRPDADWLPQLKWNPILEEAVDLAPGFVIHSGDIVKEGSDTKQWSDFLTNSQPFAASTPIMPTIGNHDDGPGDGEAANYNQVFSLPTNEVTQTEDYYYFIYGNAIFISLSSQTFHGGDFPFQEQADWLDGVLTDNPLKWKFVFLHHPPYASHASFDLIFTQFEFNHPPNENQQNAALIPIFDKHHVDIVFAGHNHYYERLGPLVQGPEDHDGKPVASFGEGTVYVITGGAGALVYDEFEIPWVEIELNLIDWVCGKAEGSKVCAGDHHYVNVEIDDHHLRFEAWATGQQTLDYNPAYKQLIDEFDIYKLPETECAEQPPIESVEPIPDVVEAVDQEVVSQPEVLTELPAPVDTQTTDQHAATVEGTGDAVAADGACRADHCPPAAATADTYTVSVPGNSDCGCRLDGTPATTSGTTLWLVAMALVFLAVRRPGKRV